MTKASDRDVEIVRKGLRFKSAEPSESAKRELTEAKAALARLTERLEIEREGRTITEKHLRESLEAAEHERDVTLRTAGELRDRWDSETDRAIAAEQRVRELEEALWELSECVMHGWTDPAFVRGHLHNRAVDIARAALKEEGDNAKTRAWKESLRVRARVDLPERKV